MDCIGTNILSGDGGTCPGFYGILLCYQNTSTGMNTDSCTGRAVHSGKNAGWENTWLWGGTASLSAGTRCRLFHVVHVDLRGRRTFHHRPFVSQPCRTLGLSRGSLCRFYFQHGIGSSRLQHICVFNHQCVIVQYDGCLMLKQDRYYDLGRILFLPMVSIFYTIFLTCAEHIDAL